MDARRRTLLLLLLLLLLNLPAAAATVAVVLNLPYLLSFGTARGSPRAIAALCALTPKSLISACSARSSCREQKNTIEQ